MNKITSISLLLMLSFFISCSNKQKKESTNEIDSKKISLWSDYWENPIEKEKLLSNSKIHKRIKECLKDTSIVILTSTLINDIERYTKIKSLGDINKDGINDSILIVPELYITKQNAIEDATSIIFTDRNIPRIRVQSACLETDYIFPVSDINEDGIIELGKYFSSCASRFKSLELISLKETEWELKGRVTFDVFWNIPNKEERIKKIKHNQFQMREITSESTNEKIDIWKDFKMK